MKKTILLSPVILLFAALRTTAQTTDLLRQQILQIASARNAITGVSISGSNRKDTLSVNGAMHFPLQSVFKFHIAIVVLAQIDSGRLSAAQKINIRKEDLLPGLYSPIREKYANGTTLTIAQILHYTVAESDNVGCDILLRLVGGPQAVEAYFRNHNLNDVAIKTNEEEQQGNWELQFQNWTTPAAATAVLERFYYNKPALLSAKSYVFLLKTMKATQTGAGRLKGQLPPGTVVAHKTGTSGTNKQGVSAAVNDIGVVFLPNGQYFFISVFVTNSREDAATNEKIIADIAKAAWDYFSAKAKQDRR